MTTISERNRREVFFLFFILAPAFLAMVLWPLSATGGSISCMAGPTGEDEDFDLFSEYAYCEPVRWDPLEPYNRFMTRVNDRLYYWVLSPAAKAYSKVVPEEVRMGFKRFFSNLGFPVRFVNNALQLKGKRALKEAGRFIVNTIGGMGGFFDPARDCLGWNEADEDFGQTLGVWGVPSGFPVVWPFFGPCNVRDSVGLFFDSIFQPVNYIPEWEYKAGAYAFETVNWVSLNIDAYPTLTRDAMDLYILLQDAYEQNRSKAVSQ